MIHLKIPDRRSIILCSVAHSSHYRNSSRSSFTTTASLQVHAFTNSQSSRLHTATMTDRDRPVVLEFLGEHEDEFKLVLNYLSFPDALRLEFVFSDVGLDDPRDISLSRKIAQNCSGLQVKLTEDLKKASMENNFEMVKKLVTKLQVHPSIAVGSICDGMMTPLCAAAMRGNHQIVSFLLHAGADVNWRDEEGTSALDFAIARQLYTTQGGESPLGPPLDIDETIRLLRAAGGRQFNTDYGYDYYD